MINIEKISKTARVYSSKKVSNEIDQIVELISSFAAWKWSFDESFSNVFDLLAIQNIRQ